MISSWLFFPLQAIGSAWTVQFGPWSLPPQAWLPATAVIGALALRTRARSFRGSMGSSEEGGNQDAPGSG